MLDGNFEDRPSVQESYAGAVSDGKTRVQEHRTTRADLIASAGMSQYSTGTALMRLVSEWQSGAIPMEKPTPGAKDLARQAAIHRVDAGIQASEEEYGGMRISDKAARRMAAPVTKHEAEFAQAEARRLAAQATDWNLEEAKLRFQRMKTLPIVRAALIHWVKAKGWDDADYLVAKVLQHFLSPKCPTCQGSGVLEFAGNNKKGAGKRCPKCSDHKIKGEQNIPCHGRGKALLSYISSCTARAAGDVSEGVRRDHRSEQSEAERGNQKFHNQIAKLRRADAEAKVDEARDNAGIAEKFRASMGHRG